MSQKKERKEKRFMFLNEKKLEKISNPKEGSKLNLKQIYYVAKEKKKK